MTQKAINSLALYRGGNPMTIAKLLRIQKPSVVEELKEHFGVHDINQLANKLANF